MSTAESPISDSAVVQTVHIQAPPDAVFDFFIVPEKMIRWMGIAASLDPKPGGEFTVKVNDDNTAIGEYVEIDRPNRVSVTWGWEDQQDVPPGASLVTFDLRPQDGGTLVTLTHSGLSEEQCKSHSEGWSHFLPILGTAAGN